jgi:hypothetical protein
MIRTATDYWNEVIDRIRVMTQLRPDWDGQGASPPKAEAIRTAMVFCRILINSDWIPPTSVIPTTSAKVGLTWRLPHFYLEFECSPDRIDFELTDYRTGQTDRGTVEGL